MRLTPTASPDAMNSSNSSMSSNSSLDDHKVMVAAMVTVLSGIMQVSTFSWNLQPPCPDWHTFFCFSSVLPRLPTLPSDLQPSSVAHRKQFKEDHSPTSSGGAVHVARISEHGSREKDKWEEEGTRGEQ